MNIGILTIATGKYKKFIVPLYKSIIQNFLKNRSKTFILFTDNPEEIEKDVKDLGVKFMIFQIERKGFPGDTLLRYHHFSGAKQSLKDLGLACPQVLYYFDADMIVENEVGDEVLPTGKKTLVVTAHPGYYARPGHNPLGTPETNEKSTAYIPQNRWRPCYWAGGFNGGFFDDFMSMSFEIASRIDKDLSNNIIAMWHDESHLNAYVSEPNNLEKLKIMSPAYCYPESWKIPFDRKILALDKNHQEIRN